VSDKPWPWTSGFPFSEGDRPVPLAQNGLPPQELLEGLPSFRRSISDLALSRNQETEVLF